MPEGVDATLVGGVGVEHDAIEHEGVHAQGLTGVVGVVVGPLDHPALRQYREAGIE